MQSTNQDPIQDPIQDPMQVHLHQETGEGEAYGNRKGIIRDNAGRHRGL